MDTITIKGSFRLQIRAEDGEIVGDSGWIHNIAVNDGINDYLVKSLGSISGSKYVTHMALGTGTEPGAADNTLQGEVVGTGVSRASVTRNTSNTSKRLQCLATFVSTNSFITQAETIKNAGLFNTETGGSLFAGNTFAQSSLATNQNVEATYNIDFATA